MSPEYDKLLNELFDELDLDKSGYLDVRAFVYLGQAMTGQETTPVDARVQLDRADKDGDEMVSRDEWMEFSTMLTRLDEWLFSKIIRGYIENVKRLKEEKRSA